MRSCPNSRKAGHGRWNRPNPALAGQSRFHALPVAPEEWEGAALLRLVLVFRLLPVPGLRSPLLRRRLLRLGIGLVVVHVGVAAPFVATAALLIDVGAAAVAVGAVL